MAAAPTISIDDIKEIMIKARKPYLAEIVKLRHEVHTLFAQNESLRKRLDGDENKRLQAKLARGTAKIAELLREREGLLTKDQAQAVRDVAAARVKAAEAERNKAIAHLADERMKIQVIKDRLESSRKETNMADESRMAALKERDEWKAKAEALWVPRSVAEELADLRFKLDAVAKIVGRP